MISDSSQWTPVANLHDRSALRTTQRSKLGTGEKFHLAELPLHTNSKVKKLAQAWLAWSKKFSILFLGLIGLFAVHYPFILCNARNDTIKSLFRDFPSAQARCIPLLFPQDLRSIFTLLVWYTTLCPHNRPPWLNQYRGNICRRLGSGQAV